MYQQNLLGKQIENMKTFAVFSSKFIECIGIQTKTVFIYCSHFSHFLFTKWELQRHVLQLLHGVGVSFHWLQWLFKENFQIWEMGTLIDLNKTFEKWQMMLGFKETEVDNRAGRLDCFSQWGQNAFWGRILICMF